MNAVFYKFNAILSGNKKRKISVSFSFSIVNFFQKRLLRFVIGICRLLTDSSGFFFKNLYFVNGILPSPISGWCIFKIFEISQMPGYLGKSPNLLELRKFPKFPGIWIIPEISQIPEEFENGTFLRFLICWLFNKLQKSITSGLKLSIYTFSLSSRLPDCLIFSCSTGHRQHIKLKIFVLKKMSTFIFVKMRQF